MIPTLPIHHLLAVSIALTFIHITVYKLMENENCQAHLLETAAMSTVIEDQITALTKISLTFSNPSKDFCQPQKHGHVGGWS